MKFAHRGKEMHECALDPNITALAYRRRKENATNYILKIEIFVSIQLMKELTEAYLSFNVKYNICIFDLQIRSKTSLEHS